MVSTVFAFQGLEKVHPGGGRHEFLRSILVTKPHFQFYFARIDLSKKYTVPTREHDSEIWEGPEINKNLKNSIQKTMQKNIGKRVIFWANLKSRMIPNYLPVGKVTAERRPTERERTERTQPERKERGGRPKREQPFEKLTSRKGK